jgi:hypothetical protein
LEKEYVFKIKYVGTTKSVLKREKMKNTLGRRGKIASED